MSEDKIRYELKRMTDTADSARAIFGFGLIHLPLLELTAVLVHSYYGLLMLHKTYRL